MANSLQNENQHKNDEDEECCLCLEKFDQCNPRCAKLKCGHDNIH